MSIKMFIGMWIMGWLFFLAKSRDDIDDIEENDISAFLIFSGVVTFLICVFCFWLFS